MSDPISEITEDSERLVVPRYAMAARRYREAGWSGVLPIPPDKKTPPPPGFTGAGGLDPTDEDIDNWCRLCPDWNLALRMPVDVVGIDVDSYSRKDGIGHLYEFMDEHGLEVLPPTWVSSARPDPQRSGIRFYRVEAGKVLSSQVCADVETVQRHHRYALVWPSIHPDGGEYRWTDPGGTAHGDDLMVPRIGVDL